MASSSTALSNIVRILLAIANWPQVSHKLRDALKRPESCSAGLRLSVAKTRGPLLN